MIEVEGDIFDFISDPKVDAICITTNGIVNNYGLAIMGAGTAGIAATKWPEVRKILGRLLKIRGNVPNVIGYIDKENNYYIPDKTAIHDKNYKCIIWSFPTKNHYKDPSDPELIKQSSQKLLKYADIFELKKIALPYPGIGKGGLDCEDVKKIIEPILDDRFLIVRLPEKRI